MSYVTTPYNGKVTIFLPNVCDGIADKVSYIYLTCIRQTFRSDATSSWNELKQRCLPGPEVQEGDLIYLDGPTWLCSDAEGPGKKTVKAHCRTVKGSKRSKWRRQNGLHYLKQIKKRRFHASSSTRRQVQWSTPSCNEEHGKCGEEGLNKWVVRFKKYLNERSSVAGNTYGADETSGRAGSRPCVTYVMGWCGTNKVYGTLRTPYHVLMRINNACINQLDSRTAHKSVSIIFQCANVPLPPPSPGTV